MSGAATVGAERDAPAAAPLVITVRMGGGGTGGTRGGGGGLGGRCDSVINQLSKARQWSLEWFIKPVDNCLQSTCHAKVTLRQTE